MQSEQFTSDRAVSAVKKFNSVCLIDYFNSTIEDILTVKAFRFYFKNLHFNKNFDSGINFNQLMSPTLNFMLCL